MRSISRPSLGSLLSCSISLYISYYFYFLSSFPFLPTPITNSYLYFYSFFFYSFLFFLIIFYSVLFSSFIIISFFLSRSAGGMGGRRFTNTQGHMSSTQVRYTPQYLLRYHHEMNVILRLFFRYYCYDHYDLFLLYDCIICFLSFFIFIFFILFLT